MGGYTRQGVSVLLIEYGGYGRSAGSPSQKKIAADAMRFYDRLAARPEVNAAHIVFHGRSLGGEVVASLARHRRPAALILQSTFTSVPSLAWRFGIPPFMVRDPFRVLPVIRRYTGPVLLREPDTLTCANTNPAKISCALGAC